MPVLVVGGPSNVGKTTAASTIGQALMCSLFHVDDLARASSDPALAFERYENTWSKPPHVLCLLLIRKGEALWPELQSRIAASSAPDRTTIFEGEGPSPAALSGLRSLYVRPAFIVERDAARLHETLWSRSAKYRALPEGHRKNVVGMNVQYAEWLIHECEGAAMPYLPSQPWNTLSQRLARAWRLPISFTD